MREKEDKVERLNLVLLTIRNIHRLLVKERNLDKLLSGICGGLIKNRGYHNAWIAIFDEKMNLVKYAHEGLEKTLSPMEKLLKTGVLTKCAQRALSQSDVLVTDDPLSECADCPLSPDYGGRAALTIRLEFKGRVYGILALSTPKRFAKDRKEQELIEEIATDIAYSLHNITIEEERAKALEALQESEQRCRDLVENSLIGISILQDGRVLYRNPEQKRLLRSFPTTLNLLESDNIHPEDVEKVRKLYKSIVSGKASFMEIEFRFYPPGKMKSKPDMKWVYCRASAIQFQGQEGILLNLLDMTKIKELERLLMIQDKMTSLGHVAAGIAHEIRNPLSGINIYLNTLEKNFSKRDDLKKEMVIVQRMQSASNKIESVIRRVMDFSKPSEPRLTLKNINESIDEALKLSSVTMRKSGIKIEKDIEETLPSCYLDPLRIEDVILNLINNATDAMRANTRDKIIHISSTEDKQNVILRIADSGPGVPLRMRDKIFDPFFTTKSDSSGIGLSISHRIISDHGGSIEIDESEFGGAKFTIKLPLPKNGRKNG